MSAKKLVSRKKKKYLNEAKQLKNKKHEKDTNSVFNDGFSFKLRK